MCEGGVELLEAWPGSSPVLNPIENCRSMVKKAGAVNKPSAVHDLQEVIEEAQIEGVTPE